MRTPQFLKLYVSPPYYFGEHYFEYYPVSGKSRDSSTLERANFDATLEALGGESKRTNAVIISRASHWAVGWVETIFVHKSASKKVKIADDIKKALENYPVVDEDLLSDYENSEKELIWSSMDLNEKICICLKAGLSKFASRNLYIPGDVDMFIEIN